MMRLEKASNHDTARPWVFAVHEGLHSIDPAAWDALLAISDRPTPFMRHAYLAALHDSGSAVARQGWTARFATLHDAQGGLAAACPLYLKTHSYGEYVFDHAWAQAYARHGLNYYPKALIAVPFTPVPGSRLLARDALAREALAHAARDWAAAQGLSSLHLLWGSPQDLAACDAAGFMARHQVQFHWKNQGWTDFDQFLAGLTQEKRKKIRQERRRVHEAGVRFRVSEGCGITDADWDLFYRCYSQTYWEHGNPPYLTRAFFQAMQENMPRDWVLFVAEREGAPIATSLIAFRGDVQATGSQNDAEKVAYGRYWGALERVDCLHFEACYYQPLQWCIAQGVARFEGGAQGEHKMARALLPERCESRHWLAHPRFAEAVDDFLGRERRGVAGYLDDLAARSPLKSGE